MLSNFVVDNQVLTGKELAQKINDVFVSFTQDIRPLSMSSQSIVPTENSMFSTPSQFIIDEKDVYNKLSTIPTNKSPGPDGIPNWVLKSYAYILSSPVASIFNASIQESVVPSTWKKADIIPVPRKMGTQQHLQRFTPYFTNFYSVRDSLRTGCLNQLDQRSTSVSMFQ